SRVEKRIAFTFPVFKLDRFTLEIPTLSDSSFRDIFRSAMTLSSRSIIAISSTSSCLNLYHLFHFLLVAHPDPEDIAKDQTQEAYNKRETIYGKILSKLYKQSHLNGIPLYKRKKKCHQHE